MKRSPALLLFLALFTPVAARADLTLVQQVEGGGPITQVTMKIKGDKVRMDAGPSVSSVMDIKTGEALSIMHEQKIVMRMSAAQAKAATAAMMPAITGEASQPAAKPKVTATGKKETINGYEAEEYVAESPGYKASYWIAKKYPQADAILKQLQATASAAASLGPMGMPDVRDLPGLPIRTNVSTSGMQVVSTLSAAKQDPLSDSDFAVPTGYQEMKMPDVEALLGGKPGAAAPTPSPKK
ncbi:MAG: DUF4412 domain-containing protein [Chthoniobacterales bacterium]